MLAVSCWGFLTTESLASHLFRGHDSQPWETGTVSDKVLIEGVGSVMVRDWPHLFLFAPFCLKGCQQLLLMPDGRGLCLPPLHGGVEGSTEVFLQHLGCWFGMCSLGKAWGTAQLLLCAGVQASLSSCPGRQLSSSQGSGNVNGRGGCVCAHARKGKNNGVREVRTL